MTATGADRTASIAEMSSAEVIAYLRGRGLAVAHNARVTALTGGVSGTVIRVEDDQAGYVVKQALAELAVPGVWRSDVRRALVEAAAMKRYGALTPGVTPDLLDVDDSLFILTMSAAPESWQSWKAVLLAGTSTPADRLGVATHLGELLARWHSATMDPAERAGFEDQTFFDQLRITPFYLDLGAQNPAVRAALERLAEHLRSTRTCLVHGDFSPKNVLVHDDGLWVVDFEVASAGAPEFDVAFMLCHLILKACDPARPDMADVARGFWAAYLGGVDARLGIDEGLIAAHTSALMLTRLRGISRVDYILQAAKPALEARVVDSVQRGPATLEDLLDGLFANHPVSARPESGTVNPA